MQWWEFRRSTWFVKPRAGRAWATSDRRTGRRRCHVTYECRPPRPERSTAWRKMHTGLWRSGSRSECLSSEHTTTEISSIWLNLYLTKLTRRGSHKYKCSDFKCVRKSTKSRRTYLSAILDGATYAKGIRLFSCLFPIFARPFDFPYIAEIEWKKNHSINCQHQVLNWGVCLTNHTAALCLTSFIQYFRNSSHNSRAIR